MAVMFDLRKLFIISFLLASGLVLYYMVGKCFGTVILFGAFCYLCYLRHKEGKQF